MAWAFLQVELDWKGGMPERGEGTRRVADKSVRLCVKDREIKRWEARRERVTHTSGRRHTHRGLLPSLASGKRIAGMTRSGGRRP